MSSKLKHLLHVFSFTLLCATGFNIFSQNATVSEGLQEFITYPYSDPNPIADVGKIYPYFRFDGYAHKGKPKKWKIVTLENAYIKLFITPEIGGKIWGALEKESGKMFIYNNDVVKFRNIAMRGPWTSGGIESNFGIIGHAPTGSSPVDYVLKKNSDGSVSCTIGALDLITDTNWQVEIRLPKDKAYFETNVLWHNNTALNQPYYHWMTGAARASEDLEFFFPGHSHIFHDGKSYSWPYDKKKHNLSHYAENDFGSYKSYHILGDYSGFFGGYYHKHQLGFGNWSTYTDKPGKKLWIWGLSRQGMIWEDLLTDNSGQYIEMQTGRLFNQAGNSSSLTPFKHREFPAYATDTWSEIWFPVKETEGMSAASKFGVLNIERNENHLKLYFSPLQYIDDDISIKINDKKIYKKHLVLDPLELFVDSISLKDSDNFQINIGLNKLNYSSLDKEENFLNRPLIAPDNFDWKSVQGLSIKGKEATKQLNYEEAMKSFLKCLEKDPNYMDALIDIAELYYQRMEFDIALNYVKRALAIDTYNGAANFIYGLINLKNNFIIDAKDGFSMAAHSVAYRSAAFTELANINASEGRWVEAIDNANRALNFNKHNLTAHQVLIISHRKLNLIPESLKHISELLKLNPLNHFARFEKYLLDKNDASLYEFNKLIRNELPNETYLNIAIKYYNLGLLNESIQVLESAIFKNPIITYWKAYLHHQLGNPVKSNSFLKDVENHNPHLVFPFRAETLDVLDWVTSLSNDWKGKYYQALIYLKKGQTEKSKKLFNACETQPDYAPFYLTRAKILEKSSLESAINDVLIAIELNKSDWRSWVMLSNLYLSNNNIEKSFNAIETIYKKNPNDFRLAIPYAKALFRSKEYGKCIDLLDKIKVLPFEGASGGRMLYRDVHILSAIRNIKENKLKKALDHLNKSRLWPENLGAGKPYNPDELLEDYLELQIRKQHKQSNEIRNLIRNINNYLDLNKNQSNNVILALFLKGQDRNEEAVSLLNKWNTEAPNNILSQWALDITNEKGKDRNWKEIESNPKYRIYYETVKLIRSISY